MSDAINVKGTVLSIGTTAVSPVSDSFVPIGEVLSFDGPGGTSTLIDVSHLQSTSKEKRKGLRDEGQFTLNLNGIFSDAGQQALINAEDDDDPYNVRVVYTDGTQDDFKALVMQFRSSGGGVDEVIRAQVTLEITGAVTRVVGT